MYLFHMFTLVPILICWIINEKYCPQDDGITYANALVAGIAFIGMGDCIMLCLTDCRPLLLV